MEFAKMFRDEIGRYVSVAPPVLSTMAQYAVDRAAECEAIEWHAAMVELTVAALADSESLPVIDSLSDVESCGVDGGTFYVGVASGRGLVAGVTVGGWEVTGRSPCGDWDVCRFVREAA
jgi:hypothetical protein